MKKLLVLLLITCFLTPILTTTVSAEDGQNSYQNPLTVTMTDESVLVFSTEAEGVEGFELNIPTSLEYQEVVVPYGTDLTNVTYNISLDKLQFAVDEDLLELHNISKDNLDGYFNNMKKETTIRYAKNDGGYQRVGSEGIKLEEGARYTIVIHGWYGDNSSLFKVSYNDIRNNKRWFDLSQERKFAFTVSVADPVILEGATHEMVDGTAKALTIKVDNDFSKFKGVECDGTLLTQDKDYTAVSGSTVVTISGDFMKTLTVGEHKIKILFSDDSSSTAIVKVTEKQGVTQGTTSPKTSDTAMVGTTLMLLAGAAVAVVAVSKKRRYV